MKGERTLVDTIFRTALEGCGGDVGTRKNALWLMSSHGPLELQHRELRPTIELHTEVAHCRSDAIYLEDGALPTGLRFRLADECGGLLPAFIGDRLKRIDGQTSNENQPL